MIQLRKTISYTNTEKLPHPLIALKFVTACETDCNQSYFIITYDDRDKVFISSHHSALAKRAASAKIKNTLPLNIYQRAIADKFQPDQILHYYENVLNHCIFDILTKT